MASEVQEQAYVHAVRDGIIEEMRRDARVVTWGQGARSGGDMSTTGGIVEEFDENRILNTPINEIAMIDMALGAAVTGLRPIVNIMAAAFVALAGDAILLKVGGTWKGSYYKGTVPLVIYTSFMQGGGMGADHEWSTEALLIHSPHLKVVTPSTPADGKGLIKTSIRDDFPVVFVTHRMIQYTKGPVPVDEDFLVPFGEADIKRKGSDITIVTYSAMVLKSLEAAETLAKDGIDVEIVDLRTLVPMDVETVVKSLAKTRRLLIAHEAMKRGGVAGEILFRIQEAAPEVLHDLKAPFRRLAAPNVILPHGATLAKAITPQVEDVVAAVKEVCA